MLFKRKLAILLDIDGVFNSLSRIEGEKELVIHPWGTWQITPENVEFLKYLAKNYKCYWISSWGDESNVINKQIGIKPFKSIGRQGKNFAITQVIDKYKNLIIIDDEFINERVKCFTPKDGAGLTKEDRNAIKEYINSIL